MKAASIPKTDSIRELSRFFKNQKRAESPCVIRIPLTAKEIKRIQLLAKAKGITSTELVQQWIREKIKQLEGATK